MKAFTFNSITVLAIVISIPGFVFGQSNEVSLTVEARVHSTIEMETIQNISFGKIQPGQEVINISPTTDNNAGVMKALGIPNAEIRISFIPQRTFTHTNGSDQLTFYYSVSGNDAENQETSELIDFDNRQAQLNEDGEFYFWVGGRVNITNAVPGQYLGDFTIEVDYL